MKLRTRITGISCLAVLAACVAVSALIWGVTMRSYQNEAHAKAWQNAAMTQNRLIRRIEELGSRYLNDNYLRYFFKTESDEYSVCFQLQGTEIVEIYNQTVFDLGFLESLNYSPVSDTVPEENFDIAALNWEGRHYLVFQSGTEWDLQYFRIEDITYVWERMGWLTGILVLITAGVLLCTMVCLSLILKKVLNPLQELNVSARRIAEGQYHQRIAAASRDEIGQLSENFNKMAAAVELRTKSLEESELKKTLFMGNLTHELKTPMTAISGYAQTLLHAKLSQEEQKEALSYIYQECGRLERLSRKMMKLLELDRDVELTLTKTPIKEIFQAVERSCGELLRQRRLTLKWTEGGQSFPVEQDLMTDAILNLVDNAAKASQDGGRILLRAGADFIEVQDFGKGIPKEEQERILEPFYMVDKSRSRKVGGAGLGLALVALIAKAHHCELKIESEVGKGTVIRLQFV